MLRPKIEPPKTDHSMPTVEKELNKKGDFLVDYEEKVFPDIKADPGEKALVTFHTIAFEGSISIVNTLTATRLQRKRIRDLDSVVRSGCNDGFSKRLPDPWRRSFSRPPFRKSASGDNL